MAELVDRYFPGIDLAPDCAEPPPRPRRIAMPAQRADEPPLDGSLREALDSIHAQLDGGRLQRAQAVTMLCALYGGRDQARRGGALLAPMRAFYRRYEALLRAYFPDLDAAECR